MDKNIETRPPAPLVHGRMIYRCEQCGRSWAMFLEKGIEEFGENHKPSPFTIECPYCGGWACDVSGIRKIPGGGYMPLPDNCHYFANREDHPCGIPTFALSTAGNFVAEDASGVIEDALERIRSREMEMCRDSMREELARVEEIADKAVPDAVEAIKKTSVIIAEKAGVSLGEAVAMVLRAIQDFGSGLEVAFAPFLGEPDDLMMLEAKEPLDLPTVWDRKEAREKRRAVERATASRFRQHKARESGWTAQKRTGQRRREWRGSWKEN